KIEDENAINAVNNIQERKMFFKFYTITGNGKKVNPRNSRICKRNVVKDNNTKEDIKEAGLEDGDILKFTDDKGMKISKLE
ncbi:MAG: hypothetical protein M1431_03965, partial [Candidatus Thermoplasmatota archaeon]|nr:hypothetical protein [Candidatus Thermoplasmatota archaeon]